jgi:hypothetical protein
VREGFKNTMLKLSTQTQTTIDVAAVYFDLERIIQYVIITYLTSIHEPKNFWSP